MPTATSRLSAASCRCPNASDSTHQRNNSYCSSGFNSAAANLICSTTLMVEEYRNVPTVLFLSRHLRGHFQPQCVKPDKPSGIILVVGLGRVGFHRGDLWVVEADRRFAARDHDVALVKLHAHRAGHRSEE